jgi:hypothetical protein
MQQHEEFQGQSFCMVGVTMQRPPSSKNTFALSHDPRTCPLCLGGGHPSAIRENQAERERQIEAIQRDFTSSLKASTTDELELVREQERQRLAEEKREQEAREYLTLHALRLLPQPFRKIDGG